ENGGGEGEGQYEDGEGGDYDSSAPHEDTSNGGGGGDGAAAKVEQQKAVTANDIEDDKGVTQGDNDDTQANHNNKKTTKMTTLDSQDKMDNVSTGVVKTGVVNEVEDSATMSQDHQAATSRTSSGPLLDFTRSLVDDTQLPGSSTSLSSNKAMADLVREQRQAACAVPRQDQNEDAIASSTSAGASSATVAKSKMTSTNVDSVGEAATSSPPRQGFTRSAMEDISSPPRRVPTSLPQKLPASSSPQKEPAQSARLEIQTTNLVKEKSASPSTPSGLKKASNSRELAPELPTRD
ncbi:unnamed protein product, partial [Amoebophrya sp. A25]